MSLDHANDPFCRRADPAIYGDRLEWLCTVTADERIKRVREMDIPNLRRVMAIPDLQATVRRAAESRLRALTKPSGVVQ